MTNCNLFRTLLIWALFLFVYTLLPLYNPIWGDVYEHKLQPTSSIFCWLDLEQEIQQIRFLHLCRAQL